MLHVAPGALRPVFEDCPTARLRDSHRAGAVDVMGGMTAGADTLAMPI